MILSGFIGSCSNKVGDYNLILIRKPSTFNPHKEPIVLYELLNDTLFIRKNSTYWSKYNFEYIIIKQKEKSEIIKNLKKLSKEKIKQSYLSKEDDLIGYNIGVTKNKKTLFHSIIYSRNYPKEVDSIYNYISSITSKKAKKIQLLNSSFSNLRIKSIIKGKDTIKLSKINSYLIWKRINIGSKKEQNNDKKGKYNLIYNYWIGYNGNRIKSLSTDNGRLFYIKIENKTYSFKMDYLFPIDNITN